MKSLREALQGFLLDHVADACGECSCRRCKDARAALDTPDGWISVEERLPDTGVTVLICDDGGTISFANLDRFGNWRDAGMYICPNDDDQPTHWQLLPEPPKSREEAG